MVTEYEALYNKQQGQKTLQRKVKKYKVQYS
jgi:hypothetical protein